jgi:uncharacterized protein YbjT (DUF2867 family)
MVVITGATGHLGNVLVRELLARGETSPRIRLLPRPIREAIVDAVQWFKETGRL